MALKFWITTPFFYPDMDRPWSEVLNGMLSIVDAAENLGFEGVSINENLFQNYVTNPSSMIFSALAAARTKRLRIMPGVVVLPNYNPLLVASEMSMIDHLAPGRLGIGVARGGSRYPMERLGVDPSQARNIYEESLEIILRLWQEDDVSYDGRYFSFPPTTIVPKPATDPHPEIWVASQSVSGIQKVAEEGHNLITATNYGNFEPHGDLELMLQAYNEGAAKSDKPRGEVMVLRHTWVGETEEAALEYFDDVVSEYNHYLALTRDASANLTSQESRLAPRGFGELDSRAVVAGKVQPATESPSSDDLYNKYADPVMTTPDKMIERFKKYEQLGVDHIACLKAMGMPVSEVIKNMELMAKEVLPAFAE